MATPIPPGYVRMQSGRLVPSQGRFGMPKQVSRRFLCVLQFYEGDRDAAESLASLIADLERTRNHDADILLMRRADCRELSANIQAKLATKFDRVLMHSCRRTGPTSYPYASNEMFYDLVMLMSQIPPYRDLYYAFLNLETDVVPTRPGWLGELIAAWKIAFNDGKAALGHIETNPLLHLNGMAIYAADIYNRAGGNSLAGGSPQVTYDIRKSSVILPMAKDTPLIFFQYRTPTITSEALFAPRKEGIVPALWHGVKDGSARAAVRARYISFTDRPPVALVVAEPKQVLEASEVQDPTSFIPDLVVASVPTRPLGVAASIQAEEAAAAVTEKRQKVYTYFSVRGRQSDESKAVIEAWRKGWTSRGWNAVVLTLRDAAKHPRFDDMADAVEKLPCIGDRHARAQSFYRWLALDTEGGGLLVDYDVLAHFTPSDFPTDDRPLILRPLPGKYMSGMFMNKTDAAAWVDTIIKYDAQPDDLHGAKPDVSDDTIASRVFPQCDAKLEIIDFDRMVASNERKSVAMERFLGKAAPQPTIQPARRHSMADEPAQAFR